MDYFAADFFQGMGLAMPDRWEPLIGVRNAGAIVRKGFDPYPLRHYYQRGRGQRPPVSRVCGGKAWRMRR